MADLLQIVDLADSNQLQLSIFTGTGDVETAPPVDFPLPLTESELSETVSYTHLTLPTNREV